MSDTIIAANNVINIFLLFFSLDTMIEANIGAINGCYVVHCHVTLLLLMALETY